MPGPYFIGGFAQNNGTTGAIPVGTAVPIGDMVIVAASNVTTGGGEISGVADSRGNTYTKRIEEIGGSSSTAFGGAMWTTTAGTALTTSDTITVSFASSVSAGQAVAAGLPGGGTVDPATATTGFGSSTPGITSPTLSSATETVFSVFTGSSAGGAWSWGGTGFTVLGGEHITSQPYITLAYQTVTTTAAVTANPFNTSGRWTGQLISVETTTVTTGAATLSAQSSLTAGGQVSAAAAMGAVSSMTAAGGNPFGVAMAAVASLTAAPGVTHAEAASMAAVASLTAAPAPPTTASVVNQWKGSSSAPVTWGNSPPALQSVVVPLNSTTSVGGGTGTPSPGNWLFAIAGWNAAATPVTVGVGDDTHMWWRPAPPSAAAGMTRTTVWYTPNLDISPQYVYVAPSGFADGMAVLVIEVTGLGPWDVVTGTDTAYANAATSLSLSLSAPASQAFILAAVTGDNLSAGTTFAPSGYTTLAPVTSSNGVDHTGDVALLSAARSITTSTSVSASSSSEDLSGFIIGVLTGAPSPVPATANPSWPWVVFEAAFGSGYQTPPDQMTWTNLQTAAAGYRLRGWSETTGIQYELDAMESSELELVIDNPDGNLSPFNPLSPYYPDVLPGTPVRIRAIAPGGTRWYTIQRNAERWPQEWDSAFRGISNMAGNDLWSVANRELATCYRAEVLNDRPYAWWPCDDPWINSTSLINAAPGNSNPLKILIGPAGLGSVSTDTGSGGSNVYINSATQAFGGNSGWMYGDSLSASWAQTGSASATAGRYLTCNDTAFPPLSGGVTVECWVNYEYAKINVSDEDGTRPGQPAASLVLWEIADATHPYAVLSLSSSGALQFTTYNGGTGTTTSIYSAVDLRNTTWMGVTVTMTQTAWTVWVNGGIVAKVSGTASMSSAWTYFLANAGTGTSGGGTSSAVTGAGNAAFSHLAVYGQVLPSARVLAHFMAAYAAFGQMPAPQSATVTFVDSQAAGDGGYAPDGNLYFGAFFNPPFSLGFPGNAACAVYVTGSAGAGCYSAPQPVEVFTWDTTDDDGFMWGAAAGPAAPEYTWYTAGTAGTEKFAATTEANYLYINSYGSGASPPASASALGDSAGQRIERIAQAGQLTVPSRCIDPSTEPVVAELDTGGQASGDAMSNIAASDNALLFIDNCGNLCYFMRSHLLAQPVRWSLGENTSFGQIPYENDADFDTDPQRVLNDIAITQFNVNTSTSAGSEGLTTGSGEAAGGLVYAPSAAYYSQVLDSQELNGNCQFALTSYLQSTADIQSQANWAFSSFGTVRQRVVNLTVKAAGSTSVLRWQFVIGVNVGDVIQVTRTPPGQPSFTSLFRVTRIQRKLDFAGLTGEAAIIADYYVPQYWGVPSYPDIDDEALNAITDMTGAVME